MGIAEKKAIRAFNETAEQQSLPRLREATGNASLTIEAVFADDMDADQIGIAATNVHDEFVPALAQVCQDDDYRGEIAKIGKIIFSAVGEITDRNAEYRVYGDLQLNGDTLNVTLDGRNSLNNGGSGYLGQYIQSLY